MLLISMTPFMVSSTLSMTKFNVCFCYFKTIQRDWIGRYYGKPPIYVETPFELKPTSLAVPKEYQKNLKAMTVHEYVDKPMLTIMVNNITYIPSITANLEGAAAGAMRQLENTSTISGLSFTQQNIKQGNKNAIHQKGSFIQSGKPYYFENRIIVQDQNLWSVLVKYNKSNKDGLQIKDRVFKSIKF
jgi:hypothetical protein